MGSWTRSAMAKSSPLCLLLVVGLSQSAPQISSTEVVRTVTTQLQPLISDAVARALQGASGGLGFARGASSTSTGLTAEEEAEYNKKLSANAQYEFGYKVSDDETQAYIAHEETRNGEAVQGKYNYVDATGALVTVNYQAGPEGYTENREVQDGAVQMRNIPGPWQGPFADTVPAGVSSTAAVGATSVPARPSLDQTQLIQMIPRQLQPQISGAVQTAISSSRRAAQPTGATAGVGVGGVFGGDNSVRIQTPEFKIAY